MSNPATISSNVALDAVRSDVKLAQPTGPRPKPFFTPRRIVLYSILFVACLYYLFPLYVMVMTSFKTMPDIRFGNIFAPPRKFRGSEIFFAILIFGSFIPYQVMLYPLVMITRDLGIFGTIPGIILVHTIFGMPILTLLFRNYFASLPVELFKAARVDGAGFWRIFFEIMLPMSLPIIVVALILQVTGIWNDFLFGVVFAGTQNYPMTVQLNNIVNSAQGTPEYNVNMAATMLTGLVPLIVYFVSGRLFVRGVAAGAVKG